MEREQGTDLEDSDGPISKRVRDRSRRERGAIDLAARRAGEGTLFQTCFLVQGCQISQEVRLGMTELPNLTGGGQIRQRRGLPNLTGAGQIRQTALPNLTVGGQIRWGCQIRHDSAGRAAATGTG